MAKEPKFSEIEQVYLSKAEQYCAAGEQCRSAVRDKLMTWGASQESIHKIIEYLVENDYINEERYCHIYCESKLHLQKWGRIKIAYQLRGKRIDNKHIEKAILNIDENEYRETLKKLAENKLLTIKEKDPRKRNAKLISFLSSHGFEMCEIHDTIKTLTQCEEEMETENN